MLATLYSAGINGFDGYTVTVECDLHRTSEHEAEFQIVGLPDAAIKEAKERVRSAAENSGVAFPSAKIVVNMAPADTKKSGSAFDLAMITGILAANGNINRDLPYEEKAFIGELSLSGTVRGVRGVLCMMIALRDQGYKEVYVPTENAKEASVVEGITVYGVPTVKALIDHLNSSSPLTPVAFNPELLHQKTNPNPPDLSDVKGQAKAKRAMEIAAAGGHNILLIGPPGTGKSMLAKRLTTILPDMSFEEAIEVTKIYSISGMLPGGVSLMTDRPFRSPHHTMSTAALAGGGAIPTPGEISLAHNGVLFLDEFPEFNRGVTEVLRQPLEDGEVTITRANAKYRFPSSFMLLCAMNPCKCGYRGHPTRKCTCKPSDVKNYMSKISGPLLDRIDIQVEMPSLTPDEISTYGAGETSATVRERVNEARAFAAKRLKGSGIYCNAKMTPRQIREYCETDEDAAMLLASAYKSMGLSARGYDRVLKLARTIADLAGSDVILAPHMAEAIQLRTLESDML